MTHKMGHLFCHSHRFYVSAALGYMKFRYESNNYKCLVHQRYVTDAALGATSRSVGGVIPAIGGVIQDEDAGTTNTDIILDDTVRMLGSFVAPVDCRLINMAYCTRQSPLEDSEGLRLAAMWGRFGTGDAFNLQAKTSTGRDWKCIGRVDIPEDIYVGDEAAQVLRGGIDFNSSNGDISAGDVVGIVSEALATSTGAMYGVVTLTFRSR